MCESGGRWKRGEERKQSGRKGRARANTGQSNSQPRSTQSIGEAWMARTARLTPLRFVGRVARRDRLKGTSACVVPVCVSKGYVRGVS